MGGIKRDLTEDMRICDAATPGNWFVMHDTDITVEDPPGSGYTDSIGYASSVLDAQFIAEARIGWPHAIQRAIIAEAQLRDVCARLAVMITDKEAAEAEVERLRETLRWYADYGSNYDPTLIDRYGALPIDDDGGKRAREALGYGKTQDYEI